MVKLSFATAICELTEIFTVTHKSEWYPHKKQGILWSKLGERHICEHITLPTWFQRGRGSNLMSYKVVP